MTKEVTAANLVPANCWWLHTSALQLLASSESSQHQVNADKVPVFDQCEAQPSVKPCWAMLLMQNSLCC